MRKTIFAFMFAIMFGMTLGSCNFGTNESVASVDSTTVDTTLVDTFAVDTIATLDSTVVAE